MSELQVSSPGRMVAVPAVRRAPAQPEPETARLTVPAERCTAEPDGGAGARAGATPHAAPAAPACCAARGADDGSCRRPARPDNLLPRDGRGRGTTAATRSRSAAAPHRRRTPARGASPGSSPRRAGTGVGCSSASSSASR